MRSSPLRTTLFLLALPFLVMSLWADTSCDDSDEDKITSDANLDANLDGQTNDSTSGDSNGDDSTVKDSTVDADDDASTEDTGEAEGTVKCSQQHTPLLGVLIKIGDDYEDTTDASGLYHIADIPAGTYSFTATHASDDPYHNDYTGPQITIIAGQTTTFNFDLPAK